MATVSKRLLNSMREIFRKQCGEEEIDKNVDLIYNAGYRMGLKARPPIPEYPQED